MTPKKQLPAFHGTAAIYEDSIRNKGLTPFRESGGVYFSPSSERAKIYAISWAVGLHAVGEMSKPEGIIVELAVPADIKVWKEQVQEYATTEPLPPDLIVKISPIDCSDLTEDQRIYYLGYFIGVVCFDYDDYKDRRFDKIAKAACDVYEAIPEELIEKSHRAKLEAEAKQWGLELPDS